MATKTTGRKDYLPHDQLSERLPPSGSAMGIADIIEETDTGNCECIVRTLTRTEKSGFKVICVTHEAVLAEYTE